MKTRADFYGMEFDWFAIDSSGFIAIMLAFDAGPVPDLVFQRIEEQRQIEEHLLKLCGYSTKHDWTRTPWNRWVWSLSKTGVFIYNWAPWEGPYARVAFPLPPRRLQTLDFPEALRNAFVPLPGRFWLRGSLRPERMVACTE